MNENGAGWADVASVTREKISSQQRDQTPTTMITPSPGIGTKLGAAASRDEVAWSLISAFSLD